MISPDLLRLITQYLTPGQGPAAPAASVPAYMAPYAGLHNQPYGQTGPATQSLGNTLPAYQQPGMSLDPAAYISSPQPTIPRPGAAMPAPQTTLLPRPQAQQAQPQQPLPSTMTQSATAADAGNPGASSFWDWLKARQTNLPSRGAMGEEIPGG